MAGRQLPSKIRQLIVKTHGTNFRKITEIVETDMPKPGSNEILVRNRYVGINASDINLTAGRYFQNLAPPHGTGMEGIGDVVQAGAESSLKEGQAVAYTKFGAFAEYIVVPAGEVVPVPYVDPAIMSIVLSGLTASISLEKEGDLKPGKTVLITGAAGGTGQFAVQLAKAAGCHVIGTCSSDKKVAFLKSIGCDRPINYKDEKLGEVLSKEYPKGLDVVYESIGKDVFDTALNNLAVFGRFIVIGQISTYQKDGLLESETDLNIPMTILSKSATLRGFFLPHYIREFPHHIQVLVQMYQQGKLKIAVDKGPNKPFTGLESIADAIDYMYSGKNVGKVVVSMDGNEKSSL